MSYRVLSAFVAFTFVTSAVMPSQMAAAQVIPTILNLPAPGTMVPLSSGFMPAMVTGITVHPENPLAFDFIITTGDESLDDAAFKEESRKLIKYFLATLTVPNRELWVNLSPYEKDRIVPPSFGNTQMGRDMLAQDYILKQLTASLMYPEDELGKKFWDRVYTKAQAKYGTTEIPMNTFNKIWIVPEDAVVYEHGQSAFVIRSRLKVMLEEDYAALQENLGAQKYGLDSIGSDEAQVLSGVTSEVVREVLIPEIEKEVNEGQTFANLRQIYNSVILATWYEQNLKGNLLGQLYVDRNKTRGVDNEDKDVNQKIYERYVEAFKKGVYNYIREDVDPQSHEVIPRKYFSGGTNMDVTVKTVESADVSGEYTKDINGIVSSPAKKVEVNLADIGSKAGPTGIEEAVARAERHPAQAATAASPVVFNEAVFTGDDITGALDAFIGKTELRKLDALFKQLDAIKQYIGDENRRAKAKKKIEKAINRIVDKVNARATLDIAGQLEVADIEYVEDRQDAESLKETKRALENGELLIEILAGGAASRMEKSLIKAGIKLQDKDYRIWTLNIKTILDKVRKDPAVEERLRDQIGEAERKKAEDADDKKEKWETTEDLKTTLRSVIAVKGLEENVEDKTLGVRHLEALHHDIEGLSREGVDTAKVFNNIKVLIHVNNAIQADVENDLRENGFFGFKPENIVIVNGGYGSTFGIQDGNLVRLTEQPYQRETWNHGYALAELSWIHVPDDIHNPARFDVYTLTPDGKQALRAPVFEHFKNQGVKHVVFRRINDLVMLVPEMAADLQMFAAYLNLTKTKGANAYFEMMGNPTGQKGGLALATARKKPFMQLVEGLSTKDPGGEIENKIAALMEGETAQRLGGIPYNRLYGYYSLEAMMDAVKAGVPMSIKYKGESEDGKKKRGLSPEPPAGDILNASEIKAVAGVRRRDLLIEKGIVPNPVVKVKNKETGTMREIEAYRSGKGAIIHDIKEISNMVEAVKVASYQDSVSSPAKNVKVNFADIGSKAGPTGIEEAVARAEGQPQETRDADASSPVMVPLAIGTLRDPQSAEEGIAWKKRNEYIFGGGFGYDLRINNAESEWESAAKFMYALGRTLGGNGYLNHRGRALITGDHRSTSDTFRLALAQGLADEGIGVATQNDGDVITTGLTSRKGLADDVDLVIQITGSHNPKEGNGVKISGYKGLPFFGPQLIGLSQAVGQQTGWSLEIREEGIVAQGDFIGEHIAALETVLPDLENPLPLVVDFRGGAAGKVFLGLAAEKGYDVIQLDSPEADLPGVVFRTAGKPALIALNDTPSAGMEAGIWDPSKPEAFNGIKRLQERIYNDPRFSGRQFAGVVFDGDGDRAGFITEDSRLVMPERMLMAFYQRMILSNEEGIRALNDLGHAVKLALDVRASRVIIDVLKNIALQKNLKVEGEFIAAGFPNHRTFVMEELKKIQDVLNRHPSLETGKKAAIEKLMLDYTSAEASGHFFFRVLTPEKFLQKKSVVDDGIMSSFLFLHLVGTMNDYEFKDSSRKLSAAELTVGKMDELFEVLPVTNEIRLSNAPSDVAKKQALAEEMMRTFSRHHPDLIPMPLEQFYQKIEDARNNPAQRQSWDDRLLLVDGIRVELTNGVWILLRKSNTSAVIVFKAEANSGEKKAELETTMRLLNEAMREVVASNPDFAGLKLNDYEKEIERFASSPIDGKEEDQEVQLSLDDEDIVPVIEITDFLKPGVGVADALQKYWQAGGRGPVFLQEIVDGTKLKKEFVLSAINGINGNFNSPFSVEPTGLNKRLDGQTQWVRFVPRFSAGEYRLPQQGLRPGASSPMAQGERGQILKEDWKYYSEKFNGYLGRLRGRGEGAKSELIDFLNDVGKTMDEEMADFPVEARYPLLKAAALLGKPDRQVLLNIIEENRSKFKSDVGDAILMMFDLVPAGWLEKMAPQMQGRVIYTVSPENLLLAGGLGYVMQVHEKFMHELGARVVSIEPMYKYRKDMHGQLQAIDYETTFNITDKREIGQDSVDVGGYVTGVRYGRGRLPNGKEVILIEEVPRPGGTLRYTNTVYDYHNFGNHSWEEFSAFFGKAVLKLIRTEEDLRKAEEMGSWRPAIVWGNDSQAAGAMALIVQEKNRRRDDSASVLRDIYPVFSTHTFGNRQNFGLDQIDRVLGQLLGLEKKYYSAAVRFNIIDMASLAIRLVDGAGGLVNMVSRKHKVVLDRDQFDPDAKTVAITNGDDLSRAWGLVKDIYKDIHNRELKDADDLTWQEARGVVEEAVRRLNVSFVDEGVSDLGVDPQKPIVSYAGRLVNVKVSPFRTFTEWNIGRLVADGFNVVLFGRLQNYKESMDLAEHYRKIEAWIETQKNADPEATAGWGRFVFKGQYNDAQKQLMLIASNLVALDSDDETGTSEWTEVNGAIALSWILASPWRLRAPDSQKVILGEGILAEANEKGINLVVPEVPQDVLLEEISVMRAKRYNRQAKDIIAEVEDAYYGAMKSKLSEAKNDPEAFYAGAVQSAKIAKVVNGYNTAAAYLTQWSKNVDTQSKWRMEARQVSKNFVAGLNAEQKQQLLNGERNGIRNFVFHVPPIASISVHERVFESGKGLRSFRIIKNAIEAEVWDGTLGHLRNGDYVKYIDGLTKGLQGQEEVLTWLNGLVADNELSWYKKDLIFSEFVGTLINGLENRRGSESSSSPVATIDLTTRPVDIDSNQTVLINHFTAREKYAGVGLDEDLIGEKKDLEQAKQQITEFLEAGRNINVAIGEFPSILYDGEDIGPAIVYDDYDLRRFPDRYNGMIGMAVLRGILQPRKTAGEPYQIIQEAIGDNPYLTKLADLIRQVEPLRKKSFEQLKREYGDLWKGFGYSQDTTVEEFALSELRSLVKKIQGKKASKNERLIEESSFEELRIGFDDMLYDRGYKGEFNEEYFVGRELYTKIVEELSNKAELENAIKILFSGISVEQIRNVSIIYQPIQAIKYQEAVSAEFQALRRGYILKALAEVVGVKEIELANLEIQVFTSSPLVEDILKGHLDSREGQAVSLEEIVQAAGVKKEQLLSKIRAINNDSQNPVLVEPAGLHTRLDNETLWVQVVRKPGRRESASLPRGPGHASSAAPGGIDLNPELLDLQIKRDANFVPLPLPQQPIEHMRIEGFVPVIINITPVTDLPMLLGIADGEWPDHAAREDVSPLPMDLGLLGTYRNKFVREYGVKESGV